MVKEKGRREKGEGKREKGKGRRRSHGALRAGTDRVG
jgi:hypothetical protein